MTIDDYLNKLENDEVGNISTVLSFTTIAIQFIVDDPNRAKMFSNDYTAKKAFNVFRKSVLLIEDFFPKLDFAEYLIVCIKNSCDPQRIYNLFHGNYQADHHARFKLVTDITCHILLIFDEGVPEEIRLDYLSSALLDFAALNLVNMSQIKKAKKLRTCPLNQLIAKIVESNKKISCKDLYKELKKDEYEDVIDSINEDTISFYKNDKQIKVVATSGLKDRLTNVKKIVNQ